MPSVDIDEDVYRILELRSEEKESESVEAYINSILAQTAKKIQQQRADGEEKDEKVKQKLRDLGYLS